MAPSKDIRPANEPLGMTEKEIAQDISVSVSWVQHDRRGARLIPFYRIGGHIRYNRTRVLEALSQLEEGGSAKRRSGAAA